MLKLHDFCNRALEITSVNNIYLENGLCSVVRLGRGYGWFDTGTHASLLEASEFVRVVQDRQNLQVACHAEIAYRKGWVTTGDSETAGNILRTAERRVGKACVSTCRSRG